MQSATINGGNFSSRETTGSRARDLGLRAQKKLLNHVASIGAGRSLIIDDHATSLLDNLYKLMEKFTKNNRHLDKKQPEKVLKNIIKLSIKVSLLQRNHQFKSEDDRKISEIRALLKSVTMSVISFYELEFSFDRNFLTNSLDKCRTAIIDLTEPYLTPKSIDRCHQIFNYLTQSEFLDSVFKQDSEYKPILAMLVDDFHTALDAEHI